MREFSVITLFVLPLTYEITRGRRREIGNLMAKYDYVALDSRGKETQGMLEVASQSDAISRIKDMGFFPTQLRETGRSKDSRPGRKKAADAPGTGQPGNGFKLDFNLRIPGLGSGVKPAVLTDFTRELATLVEAGLPLLRGLRVLHKQEHNPALKRIILDLAAAIEGGSTFSEGLARHPKVFNRLFVNMVKAGEIGGVLEVVLNRLAEFMEKAQKIKGKVVAAMFYPSAVMIVAVSILVLLMVLIVPKFKLIFADMLGNDHMPPFTDMVLSISDALKTYTIMFPEWAAGFPLPGPVIWGVALLVLAFKVMLRTRKGRYAWDKSKLKAPVLGKVVSKVAIARFARTLGTLVSSGVPILQALTIVKETAGNLVIAGAVGDIYESVKEGETITAPLEKSAVFPPMVISMVDVGEQTGALPEMLLRIANKYDDDVDNAVAAMTSLLEPIMIVFLAVIVGSIVIALFLPLIALITQIGGDQASANR